MKYSFNTYKRVIFSFYIITLCSCNLATKSTYSFKVFETSKSGHKLSEIDSFKVGLNPLKFEIFPDSTYQTITGFGGAFTESTSHLLMKMSPEKRAEIIDAYFSDQGAKYSLTRTHMNSCDFSVDHYSYAPVKNDTLLKAFTIKPDEDDVIPVIKLAQKSSSSGFKIIASPWTAPPWMKTNNNWVGGELLPKYYKTWALFFSKYISAYEQLGIDIWGVTVENEPLGNGNNWESMHYTPESMTQFVTKYLGPQLEADFNKNIVLLGYDQNRQELKEWVDEMYKDSISSSYYNGTAIHWYESTYDYFPKALQYAHAKAPNKYLIQTEACVDSEVPVWNNDNWYWEKYATDWGYDWREAEKKYLHPKYAPVNRYARDIIGCMNNWVDGWVDWNMVLDKQGGPNWFKNWCVAPVIVEPETDSIYYTPLYYVMSHFSKFIRPGAEVVKVQAENSEIMVTAAVNLDGSVVFIAFNEYDNTYTYEIEIDGVKETLSIGPQSLQTVVITN